MREERLRLSSKKVAATSGGTRQQRAAAAVAFAADEELVVVMTKKISFGGAGKSGVVRGDGKRSSDSNTAAAASSTVEICSLPEEVLLRIFWALPWPWRVRAQRVSKHWRAVLQGAWGDLRYFDETLGITTTTITIPRPSAVDYLQGKLRLLGHRIGRQLTSVQLVSDYRSDDDRFQTEKALTTQLAECPKLRHLSLCRWGMHEYASADMVDFMYQRYGTTLKSLNLEGRSSYTRYTEMFRNFSSLEFLRIAFNQVEMLRLPPAGSPLYANLHYLALQCNYFETHSVGLKDEENMAVLCELPALRALTLQVDIDEALSRALITHLYPRLTHLCLWVESQWAKRVAAKLIPHLGGGGGGGGNLKALELNMVGRVHYEWEKEMAVEGAKNLVFAVATHLQRHLEHLIFSGLALSPTVACMQWLKPLSRMKKLRSLELPNIRLHRGADWGWLVNMPKGMMEYLRLKTAPPVTTMCRLIRSCKKLRVMHFEDNCPFTGREIKALLTATSASGGGGGGDGQGQQQVRQGSATATNLSNHHHHLPLLYVRLGKTAEENNELSLGELAASFSRLRFYTGEVPLPSHVLRHHKYGSLSEGPPPFCSE